MSEGGGCANAQLISTRVSHTVRTATVRDDLVGWWHWSVINLPASVSSLAPEAGAVGGAKLPQGASQVRIDYGVAAWGGTCPPQGDKPHRYIFTVHALKTEKLELPADATGALAG